MQHFKGVVCIHSDIQSPFIMSKRHRQSCLLKSIKTIDFKCDRILGILDVMRGKDEDSMLESIKESAREMYLCSLEERRRTGNILSISKHD